MDHLWAIPTLISIAGFAGLMAFVVWRRPPSRIFTPLLVSQAAAMTFAIGDLIVTLAPDMRVHAVGLTLTYAGLLTVGPAWLLLSLAFAEHQLGRFPLAKSPWRFAPVGIAGLLFVAFATSPWHDWFITPHVASRSDYHALWYVHAGHLYALMVACCGLYLYVAHRNREPDARTRALLMAGATAAPTLGNLAYVLAPTPLPADPAAVGLCISCILFCAGIYRRQLFAISAIALGEILHRESDAVVLLGDSGHALYANPAARDLFAPDSLDLGSRALDILAARLRLPGSPEQQMPTEQLLTRFVDGLGTPGGRLYRFGSRHDRWLRVEATPVPLRRGRGTGLSLRLHDETALHTAMDAIEDQASVLRATLAATNEGLMVADPDGTIRYFNARWREMLELPDLIQAGSHVDCVRDHVIQKLSDRKSVVRQFEGLRDNPWAETLGELPLLDGRVLESASQPLVRDEELRGRVWRLRDLTEQRHSEAMMRHSQKLESLGVMAGGIAHDFNNLLAVVMGNASLARDEVEPGSIAATCLEDVSKAAERAGALTEQLLVYAGRSELELEQLDVSQVVQDVVDLIGLSVPKAVHVRYTLDEALPAVTGDASQLRQIVMNLILNGADAILAGPGSVRVETRSVEVSEEELREQGYQGKLRTGRHVCLQVTDDGCGMDEDTVERIFEPFFTTKFAGRGLGLAATLGIVASHHGALHVASAPGRGSTFTLLLPCRGEHAPKARGSTGAPGWSGEGTVLVVDDDEAVRVSASRILRSAGLTVIPASDGAEAVSLYAVRRGEIDAVLLDVTMPKLSGVDAWRALRGLDPDARILLSSGYPKGEVMDDLAGEQRLHFVRKPYEKGVLLERIRETLGADGPPAEPRSPERPVLASEAANPPTGRVA